MNVDLDHLEALARLCHHHRRWIATLASDGCSHWVQEAGGWLIADCGVSVDAHQYALYIATFDPPMILALIERLRQAEDPS